MTGQQMCEFIAEVWKERDGVEVTPEAIWAMSPSGELWPVMEAYADALAWRGLNDAHDEPDTGVPPCDFCRRVVPCECEPLPPDVDRTAETCMCTCGQCLAP